MLENLLTLYPEYNKWYGPTLNKREGRYYIYLSSGGKVRSSLSFARAIMECKLNRKLTKSEHVDHINENKIDDREENLQVLTPKENNQKSNSLGWVGMICPKCGNTFKKEQFRVNQAIAINKKNFFCSRYCASVHRIKR